MKFSTEFGIQLDDEIRQMLTKAVTFYRSKNQFAHACQIPGSLVFHWLRAEDTTIAKREQGHWITWDVWKNIRPILIKHQLIDSDDIRWLTPSEMRSILQRQQADESNDLDEQMLNVFHSLEDENKPIAIGLVQTLVNGQIKKCPNSGNNVC